MALATRCPHCQTTFRVAQDQLKLRAGLVKCGACKQIFNGVDHLLQAERQPSSSSLPAFLDKTVYVPVSPPAPEPQPAVEVRPVPAAEIPPAAVAAPAPAPHTEETANPREPADFSEFLAPPVSGPSSESTSAEPPPEETQDDPLQRITLIDFSEALSEEEEPDTSSDNLIEDALSAAADEPSLSNAEAEEDGHKPAAQSANPGQSDPPRTKTLDELRPGFRKAPAETVAVAVEEDEPEFVRKGRRKQRFARKSRMVMGIGSLILLLVLTAQGAYAFRDALAASSPQMKAMLAKACESLGCSIRLPAQIDSIVLESSDFQSLPDHANTLVLTMLLRNQSRTVQAWPQIELTLNDANDKPIARRILPPQDYLPSGQDPRLGFQSHSEQSVKTYLQVSQLKPDGYRLYLFYP